MLNRFAVVGNPIAHSRSPDIHHQFAAQFGHAIQYDKQRVGDDDFQPFVRTFFAEGGSGLNVTVPFKLLAFDMADRLSERASLAGAVNTLYMRDGELWGDNTDGIGMVNDIVQRLAWGVSGKRVLILGAGGAVRGVLKPLIDKNPESIVIANRTIAKAKLLAEQFSRYFDVQSLGYSDVSSAFDLVINGTSTGLDGAVPPIQSLAVKSAHCYDMFYAASQTPFNQWCMNNEASAVADGLGMLVHQILSR